MGKRRSAARGVLAGGTLLAAAVAQAASIHLLQPLEPALRAAGVTAQPVVQLRFGGASAQGLQLAGPVQGEGHGRPLVSVPTGAPGVTANVRASDAEICQDAFDKAVADLRQRAHAAGAVAVVGITSYYARNRLDSSEVYQCRIGVSRGIVDLRGQLVRSLEPVAARSGAPAAHALPVPQATGHAAIHEMAKLPYRADTRAYADWLLKPTPRAYAVHASGRAGASWGAPNAMEIALRQCEQQALAPCTLYAVDEQVVWSPDASTAATLKSLGR